MANIRVLLAEVTAQDVALHATLLEELRTRHDHSISPIQTEEAELPEEFMCFEYALGLAYSKEYLGIREYEYQTRFRPIGANEEFMAFMLAQGLIDEIASSETQKGDLIVYFDDGKPTHAGLVAGQGRVRSKWGRGLLVEHELFEAPAIYGYEIKYFSPIDVRHCEDAFIEYAKSKGREFATESDR